MPYTTTHIWYCHYPSLKLTSIIKLNYYDAYSLFDILRKSGIKTYWLSNQFYLGEQDYTAINLMAIQTVDYLRRFSAKLVDHNHKLRNYDGSNAA